MHLLPDISIIIPCYNAGVHLQDAIASIEDNCRHLNYEIIITNDGSTDEQTLSILSNLPSQHCIVLHQPNKGPAAARNIAVEASAAPYLFFLDSDNRVRKNYIEKGIAFLEKHPAYGVVYGKPYFFGETGKPRFVTKAFDFNLLLFDNYIDTCSVIRRKVWEDVKGFDENRIVTHEDWEFWISVALAGWKFHFIDKYLFDYRIAEGSRVTSYLEETKHNAMREYVFKKHLPAFIKQYRFFATQYFFYEDDQRNPFRSFIKYIYYKYFKKRQPVHNEMEGNS